MNLDEAVVTDVSRKARAVSPPRDFDALFAEEHERLYRGLLFITGSPPDAEELMQEAFLKLWERWERASSIDDPVAYLFRIALNASRMRARRAVRLSRKLLPLPPTPDPFAHVEARQDLRMILGGIPPRQRAALVLTEVFGYTSEQAGEIMRIRAGTVRMLASQGRTALRRKERNGDV
jgi:RNA polymerase sigma-70 factor (ECF subfamily)